MSDGTETVTQGRMLYVGNLAWDVAWQDLKDCFAVCGLVVRADVPVGDDGRSRGYGLVEMAQVEEAQLAVQTLNDTELKGRTIFVREDREPSKPGSMLGGGGSGPSRANANSSGPGRRLYIGNLSYECAWYDLKDHFKQCGSVVRADIMEEAGGRSKGCGLVEYAQVEEAQRAISTLNDTELKGRTIFVREDREASGNVSGPVAGRRLYIGNLSYECAWYDLKDHFKQCGSVVRADIMEEAGGRSKGCGLVEYALAEEAQRAISTLNDTELKGRTIFVREDREVSTSRPGGSNVGGGNSNSNSSGTGNHNGGASTTMGTRVFVGNLAWDVSWPQLKDHFKPYGAVTHADVPVGSDGRSRGYGVVEFKFPKDALWAIHKLNGSMLGGRSIKLREYGNSS